MAGKQRLERVEKSVFVSYRRKNISWALNIYQNLTHRGYDVFFDYTSIRTGDFEQVILGNIKSRAHFLVVLTPDSLDRCGQPGDWLRREIETALKNRRNIVPLMLDGFDFDARNVTTQLTGTLARLPKYQALGIPSEYFFEGMDRLIDKLDVPLTAVLHPAPRAAREAATQLGKLLLKKDVPKPRSIARIVRAPERRSAGRAARTGRNDG